MRLFLEKMLVKWSIKYTIVPQINFQKNARYHYHF